MASHRHSHRLATGILQYITRRFSTAAEAAAPPKKARLYRELTALGRSKKTAASVLNECTGEVKKPELVSCIHQLRRFKNHDNALQIMEWMEASKFNFGFRDHALRMELIAEVKGIDAAENYFNHLQPVDKNTCTYGSLLFCYCQKKMADKALEVFARMDKMNMLSGPLPFSGLMSLYLKLGQPEKVPSLMEELKKRKIKPNVYAYTSLMQSYSCLNDIEGVERVFQEMKGEHKEQSDWTTYSNLATLYIDGGCREKAQLALQRLEKEMNSHNREAYHFLISLYAKISDLQEVHRIWKSMKLNFKGMTNKSYLIMLQALCKLNDIAGVKKCYEEWESSCSSFDVRLADTAVGAFLKHDKPDEAEKILQNALDKSQWPFFKSCEWLMTFYLKKHQPKKALQYLEVATSRGGNREWKLKWKTVEKFFKYFKDQQDVSHAEELYKLMKRINCVDSYVYISLLRTYIAAGQAMPNIRARIEEDGVTMSRDLEQLVILFSLDS